MSKSALVEKMRSQTAGLTADEAGNDVDRVFVALRGALEEGRDVRIPGFGTFKRKFVDTKKGRNPRTGESVTIAAHHKVVFREPKTKR